MDILLALVIFLLGSGVGVLCERLRQGGSRRSVHNKEHRLRPAFFDEGCVEIAEDAARQGQTNLLFLLPGKTRSRRKNG